MKKPLLTIGMIFKNEIRCLERCLKSLEPLRQAIPCEVVMADTGSTDGSREIAEKYADIVFDFSWVDDFSAARNAVMDRSSGEWYLSLDADEWLYSGIADLKEALLHPIDKHYLMCLRFRNFEMSDVANGEHDVYSEFLGVRIARNGMGIRYHGRVHEAFVLPETDGETRVMRLETVIFHDGYAFTDKEAAQAKWSRNMDLLRKTLEEDPDNLHTLSQCMDSTRNVSEESVSFARRALEVLHRNWERWKFYGSSTYRDVIFIAHMYKQPELLEWAERALELYPESIFIRVDVACIAFGRCWENKDTEGLIRWSEIYRKGLSDYRKGNFDQRELLRGVVNFAAPCWERQLLVFLVKEYLKVGRYDDSLSTLELINGAELSVKEHVEICAHSLVKLQSVMDRDLGDLTERFWEQINQPVPTEDTMQMRRAAFLNIASYALTPQWREEEIDQLSLKRCGYTALLPLEGKCALGDAAAIMEISDPAELAARVAKQDIKNFPISALVHALECGMAFPLPGYDLTLEEMDALAGRLTTFDKFQELAEAIPTEGFGIQQFCWKRTLLLAGVRNCKWDKDSDMALAKAFVAMERQFLPVCYAQSALTEEGSILLPPLHRFGWYCTRAFDSFEAGDVTNYVRLLRQGLETCPEMKPMVEFLVEQLEKNDRQQEAPELLILAQQVRQILAQYAPGSPMVEEIKRSEAYQKVSYLLEDAKVIGFGGLPQ